MSAFRLPDALVGARGLEPLHKFARVRFWPICDRGSKRPKEAMPRTLGS